MPRMVEPPPRDAREPVSPSQRRCGPFGQAVLEQVWAKWRDVRSVGAEGAGGWAQSQGQG